jgi:hypothetical protein
MAVGEQGDQQAFDQPFLAQDLGGQELSQRDYRFTVILRFASSRVGGKSADVAGGPAGGY